MAFLLSALVLFNFAASVFPLILDWRSRVHQLYFFLILILNLWLINGVLIYETDYSVITVQLSYAIACYFPISILLFLNHFPKNNFLRFSRFDYSLVTLGILLSILSFKKELLIQATYPVHSLANYIIIFGPLHYVYALFIAGGCGYAVARSLFNLRLLEKPEKRSLLIFLFGLALSLLIGNVCNLILTSIFLTNTYVHLGKFGTIFMTIFSCYAILKHHLYHYSVRVTKWVSWALILAMGLFVEASILWLYRYYISKTIDTPLILILCTFTILFGTYFHRLRVRLQSTTEKLFLKDHLDYKRCLMLFSAMVSRYVGVQLLDQSVREFIRDELDIAPVRLFIGREDGRFFDVTQKQLEPFQFLRVPDTCSPFYATHSPPFLTDQAAVFAQYNAQLCVPLLSHRGIAGCLFLGSKLSEDPFTPDDLDMFEKMALELGRIVNLSVAFEALNAQLLVTNEDVHDMHEELESQVDAQTSDLRERHRALLGIQEDIESADAVKTQFLANMSHELRTPLHAIMGFNQELIHLAKQGGALQVLESLRMIEKAAYQLLILIEHILHLSEHQDVTSPVQLAPFDLRDILDPLPMMMRLLIQEKPIVFEWTHDCEMMASFHVMGDAFKLNQIVMNLLGNAAKYTEQGRIELLVKHCHRDTVSLDPLADPFLEFQVRDTGPGIAADQIPKLFDAYTRCDSDSGKGTGLGLSITKTLVTQLGGTISCDSILGKGTCFTVSIPVSWVERTHEVSDPVSLAAPLQAEPSFLAGKRVMVCDDVALNREFLHLILSPYCEVTLTDSAFDCFIALDKTPHDVILLDIQMPNWDGVRAFRFIRRMKGYADVPILAVTAQAMIGDRERLLSVGFDGYLAKPFGKGVLFEVLRGFF